MAPHARKNKDRKRKDKGPKAFGDEIIVQQNSDPLSVVMVLKKYL